MVHSLGLKVWFKNKGQKFYNTLLITSHKSVNELQLIHIGMKKQGPQTLHYHPVKKTKPVVDSEARVLFLYICNSGHNAM